MSSLRRKLIISGMAMVMTAACLTTTTYAWFARNSEAWTSDLELEIESYDNFLISIDGVQYRSTLPASEVKRGIASKAFNLDINEVTPEIADDYIKKMKLRDVTTSDLNSFKTVNPRDITDGYYNLVEALPINYYKFDLYFRIDQMGIATDSYDLTFISNKYAKGSMNEEIEEDSDSELLSKIASLPTKSEVYSSFRANDKDYSPGDTIDVNLKDAARIGIIHDESQEGITIYEPYIGYGSYAILGAEDEIHNPLNNLMLNHINSYGSAKLKPLSEDKDVYLNTEKDFESEISFGRFTPTADGKYRDLKITVCVWLEGFDSDYVSPVDDSKLSFKLSFRKKEVE